MIRRVRPLHPALDAVDTATQAHLEMDNTEPRHCTVCGMSRLVTVIKPDGVCTRCARRQSWSWLFTRSRFSKARIMDGLAVALLLAVCACLGAAVFLLSTGTAKADTADAIAYAAHYGDAICANLDEFPTPAGVYGTGEAVMEHSGMSANDAGQAIAFSVYELCPRHWSLILRVARAGSVTA